MESAWTTARRRLDAERLDMMMTSTPRVYAAVGAPANSGKSSVRKKAANLSLRRSCPMSMMRTGAAVAMCDGAAAAATSAGHLRSGDRSFSAHISRRSQAFAPKTQLHEKETFFKFLCSHEYCSYIP